MPVIFAVNSHPACQRNAMRNHGNIAAISHRVVCVIAVSKQERLLPIRRSLHTSRSNSSPLHERALAHRTQTDQNGHYSLSSLAAKLVVQESFRCVGSGCTGWGIHYALSAPTHWYADRSIISTAPHPLTGRKKTAGRKVTLSQTLHLHSDSKICNILESNGPGFTSSQTQQQIPLTRTWIL